MNSKKNKYVSQNQNSEMNYFRKKLTTLLFMILLFGLFPTDIHAGTFKVDNFASLNNAISDSTSGDIIQLSANISNTINEENANLLEVPTNNNLTLDLKGCNLEINVTGNNNNPIKLGASSNLTIENSLANSQAKLKITNSSKNNTTGFGAGINNTGASLTLQNIIVDISVGPNETGAGIGGGNKESAGTLIIDNSTVKVTSIGSGSGDSTASFVTFKSGNLAIERNAPTQNSTITSDGTTILNAIPVTILDSVTRKPISNVKISVDSRFNYTDISGKTKIYSVSGENVLSMTHSDYISSSGTISLDNTSTTMNLSLIKNSAPFLSALTLTERDKPVAFSPVVSDSIFEYSATVLPSATQISIIATPKDSDATVSPYNSILNPTGETKISFTVTRANKSFATEYTIVVTKVPVSQPQITPIIGVVGQDLVLTFANSNVNDLTNYMAGITSVKYNNTILTLDNNVTSGFGRYKIVGNSVTIFKENITTDGSIPIEFLNSDANPFNFNLTISPPTITNPTVAIINNKLNQDLILEFSNSNSTDLAGYLSNITAVNFVDTNLARDNSASSGFGKYRIDGNRITIFKENITSLGNKIITITVPNAVTQSQTCNVNILALSIQNPTIKNTNGLLNKDLVIYLENTDLVALNAYISDITNIKYDSNSLTRDNSVVSGLNKYRIDGNKITIFKENITSLGNKIITITVPNAVTQSQTCNVNILASSIQNPTIKNTNGLLNKDLVIYLENTNTVTLNAYISDITSVKYDLTTLTRDNSVVSGLNKYRIDGNKITIFKENITSLGNKIITITAPNAVTQSQTCNVNILASSIQNPTIKNTNGLLNKDLVIYLENTNTVTLNAYITDITSVKYDSKSLTRDNSVVSGLNKYRIDGNKITIFKENITSLGKKIITITAPNAVTQSQTCTVNILASSIQNPTISTTKGLLNKDLVIYLENTNTVALNAYISDITSVKYDSTSLTRDNSVVSGLNKYRIDGNRITIFKENIASLGDKTVIITTPNAVTVNKSQTISIHRFIVQNPTITSSNNRINFDLQLTLSGNDFSNYMNDITEIKYDDNILSRNDSASEGFGKYKVVSNNIIIFKENISSIGNHSITIVTPNTNLPKVVYNVNIYPNSGSGDNGSSSQGNSNDKTYEPSKIYTTLYTLNSLDDKSKSDSNGYIVVNYVDVSYKLPYDIINNVVGLSDYIYKYGYSLTDLSVCLNIETLSINERTNLNLKYKEKFKGELVSNPYKISLSLLDKNGKSLDFDMNSFISPITFTLNTTKEANTVLKYDAKKEVLMFTPSILRSNLATINTKNHSIYVVAKNNSSFLDVNVHEWFYSQVMNAANKGLVFGVGNSIYQPNREVTRAEFVQMIVKAVQVPEYVSNTKEYKDVLYSEWFYDPIMRAKSYGLLDSFSSENFAPNQAITREEMASILATAAIRSNMIIPNQNVNLNLAFSDTNQMSTSRISDIELVYKLRIMQGMDNGQFSPKGYTTRAQAATVQLNILRKSGAIEN